MFLLVNVYKQICKLYKIQHVAKIIEHLPAKDQTHFVQTVRCILALDLFCH